VTRLPKMEGCVSLERPGCEHDGGYEGKRGRDEEEQRERRDRRLDP